MASSSRPSGRVLVVEDEEYVRESLVAILKERDFEADAASSVDEAAAILARSPIDVVLSDLRMPDADGLDLVRRFQEEYSEIPIVILTGHGTVSSAVDCLRAGASDYVLKPVGPEALEVVIERAIRSRSMQRELRYLRKSARSGPSVPIGESATWRRVIAMADAAAVADSTVLLVGESGTGKELLARRIHELSPRASQPFVKVNCAAIPLEMWESEFFGHRKGSFTGATSDREGRFQLAHRGTLLLDEVGAMPAAGQAKLLRAIQDGAVDRLGDATPTRVDVRILASTNSDLEADVARGAFRSDLFFRLNVLGIGVPPLRERPEDIPLLTRYFTREIAARLGRPAPTLHPATLERWKAYDWPGNVRELQNVLERALVLDPTGGLKDVELLPSVALGRAAAADDRERADLHLRTALSRLERELVLEALRRSGGSRKDAARLLGIDPRNLSYYLHKHGLDNES